MDDTEKLAQMMIRCGLATGHGDTIDDLIFELEKQIKNTSSDAQKEIDWLREALVEAEAELIYLRRHGKDGARWEANDSKDVWRGFAREALKEKE